MKLIHAMAGFTAAALATSALALTYPDTQRVDIIDTYDGIGWTWTSDYGFADNLEQFKALYAYSPLHTIKAGTKYPPTLVMTADHDDRVVPTHSFKYAPPMQAANNALEGSGPLSG
jgi:acetyl esterase/lipase